MPDDSKTLFKKGVPWSVIGSVINKITWIPTIMILARNLSSRDFGLIAMATSATHIIALLGNVGVNAFIVQKKRVTLEYFNACFWLNTLVLICIGILIIIFSYPLSIFFNENVIISISYIIGIKTMMSSLNSIHTAILYKKLQIKKITIREMIVQSIKNFLMICMALSGFGVYSLIIPDLIVSPLRTLISWYLVDFRPTLHLNMKCWKKIWNYGKHILSVQLFSYLKANADYLIIGKMLGAEQLGFYKMAYTKGGIISQPIHEFIGYNTFPLFSSLKTNLQNLKSVFLKIILRTYFIGISIMIFLIFWSKHFIIFFLGDKWLIIRYPFIIFLILNIFILIKDPWNKMIRALGRPDLQSKFLFFELSTIIPVIMITAKYGIVYVAIGITLVNLLFLVISILKFNELLNLKIKRYILTFKHIIIFSCIIIIYSLLLKNIFNFFIDNLSIQFVLSSVIFVVFFLIYTKYYINEIFLNFIEILCIVKKYIIHLYSKLYSIY